MTNKVNISNSLSVTLWGYTGFTMMFVGCAMILNLITLFFYPEEIGYAKYFVIPAIPTILIGYFLFSKVQKQVSTNFDKKYDFAIVLMAWITSIVLCAFPYLLTGEYSVTQCIFESTSGLTTTCLTVMDAENLPKIFLMFRSLTVYVGGIGLILIMTSLLDTTLGMRLYSAEGHPDKLIPNVLKSARLILILYTGYIIVGTVLYIIFGMHPFDAINHAIAAVANGGFSTMSANIGYYNSIPIEIITMILMILGGTNFMLNLMLMSGKFRNYLSHCETKTAIIIWIITAPILACALMGCLCLTFGESFRIAIFHIISAMATAGFQLVPNFDNWSSSAMLIMSLMMIIGFQAGSTAGGIKLYRISIVFKSVYYDIKSKLKKERVIQPRRINLYGKNEVLNNKLTFESHNYILVYLSIIVLGTLCFTFCGYTVEQSLFEFSSVLGCVGLSTGITGINASNFINWIAIIGMLVGRLDIYPVALVTMVVCQDADKGIKKVLNKKDRCEENV